MLTDESSIVCILVAFTSLIGLIFASAPSGIYADYV